MKNKYTKQMFTWGMLVFCVMLLSILIVFLTKSSIPSYGSISDGLVAIVSAFIGIVVTMAITGLLLDAQTKSESAKEIYIIQFQKKQEAYQRFLETFGNIVICITERNLKGNDKTPYQNFTKLEELIFQFSYLKAHMNNETFCRIMDLVADVFYTYRGTHIYEHYKNDIETLHHSRSILLNKDLYNVADRLSNDVFLIASILHHDLYETEENGKQGIEISNSIHSLLQKCGLQREEAQDTTSIN